MTKLVRRVRTSPRLEERRPTTTTRAPDDRGDVTAQPALRMQDVVRDLGEPPISFGVDPASATAALELFLRRDKGSDKPFCTCGEVRGWSFDCQIGVYVHAIPTCWKPSKGYYEAALRAGLLGEVPLKDAG